ncbi:MAG: hypothetical protein KDA91_19530 [Planctomycetaceae bacterium]|nr:hypothetical protein [Planctomycetaceae bacterium]
MTHRAIALSGLVSYGSVNSGAQRVSLPMIHPHLSRDSGNCYPEQKRTAFERLRFTPAARKVEDTSQDDFDADTTRPSRKR